MKTITIEEVRNWVATFNAIPISVIEKLEREQNDIEELTTIAVGDTVCVMDERLNYVGNGEVTAIDSDREHFTVNINGFAVETDITHIERDCCEDLPMYGTMWSFPNGFDAEWAREHIAEISDCGFRIYEQVDFGIIIGIDGAGYNFYEAHWLPLYKAYCNIND